MYWKWVAIFFLCTLSTIVYSYNTKGVLNCFDKNLVVGGSYDCTLTLKQFRSDGHNDFKQLEGSNFLNLFYINEIYNLKRTDNNVTIEVNLYPTKFFKNKEFFIYSFRGLNIPIELQNINILKNKLLIKKYITWDQPSEDDGTSSLWIWLLVVVILGGIAFVIIRQKKEQPKSDKEIEDLKAKIEKAQSRSDMERVYARKEVVIRIIGIENEAFQEFRDSIVEIQYKPVWTPEEEERVREKFKKLKGEINGV
jgi:hypothetical protein